MRQILPRELADPSPVRIISVVPHTSSLNIFLEMQALLADKSSWCKGRAVDRRGKNLRYCLLGALDQLCPRGHPPNLYASHILASIIEDRRGAADARIAHWNDAKHRVHADVLRLLEIAVDVATAAGQGKTCIPVPRISP